MKRRRRERGQGLVEFAVVLPVILIAVFGLLDLGRAVFTYNSLAQAARQAARTAIVDQDVASVRATAYSSAPTVGLAAANVDVCFKTDDSTATDCSTTTNECPQASRVIGCLAIVRTHLDYQPMTPILGTLIGSISLSSVSIAPIEYVCPYDTATSCP